MASAHLPEHMGVLIHRGVPGSVIVASLGGCSLREQRGVKTGAPTAQGVQSYMRVYDDQVYTHRKYV